MAKYVLRDLRGVAALEERLQKIESHPNPEWAPEIDELDDHVERVSLDLFGISEETLSLSIDVEEDGSPVRPLLEAKGWDLTDANGELMLSFPYLVTAMYIATDGLAGRLPDAPPSDAEIEQRSPDWQANIEASVAKWRKGRA